jgi:dTDP-4-dehydrorhamnose 3,5-epimerase-like enzyme
MPYTVIPTSLPEVLILEPKVFGDPTVGIQWPMQVAPLLATKDAAALTLDRAEVFD